MVASMFEPDLPVIWEKTSEDRATLFHSVIKLVNSHTFSFIPPVHTAVIPPHLPSGLPTSFTLYSSSSFSTPIIFISCVSSCPHVSRSACHLHSHLLLSPSLSSPSCFALLFISCPPCHFSLLSTTSGCNVAFVTSHDLLLWFFFSEPVSVFKFTSTLFYHIQEGYWWICHWNYSKINKKPDLLKLPKYKINYC